MLFQRIAVVFIYILPFLPTVVAQSPSIAPSVSYSPSYGGPICYICGSADQKVAFPDQNITINNITATCGDLELGSLIRQIPPEGCSAAQKAGCNCTAVEGPSVAPAVSLSDAPSASPITFSEPTSPTATPAATPEVPSSPEPAPTPGSSSTILCIQTNIALVIGAVSVISLY